MDAASLNALKSYTLSMEKISAMQAAMDEGEEEFGHDEEDEERRRRQQDHCRYGGEAERHAGGDGDLSQAWAERARRGGDAVRADGCGHGRDAYPSAAPKLADRMSPAQVAFYKQHQAELKKVTWLNGG